MTLTATAPCRISLFGGGTDLPVFYQSYTGCVISAAISCRQHFELDTTRAFFEYGEGDPSFYNTILVSLKSDIVGIKTWSDVPIRSGLGSSAAAAVCLVAAVAKEKGTPKTKQQIAEEAWHIEVDDLGLYGGKQDQYAAACGGMNVLKFEKRGSVRVYPFAKEVADYWQDRLLLFFTGQTRTNPHIQEQLKTLSPHQIEALDAILFNAIRAQDALMAKDVTTVATLLRDSWEHKKKSNSFITTDRINDLYTTALSCNALGGKLCGSGGGGHMLFLAEPDNHAAIKEALEKKGATWVDFSFDWEGVKVV